MSSFLKRKFIFLLFFLISVVFVFYSIKFKKSTSVSSRLNRTVVVSYNDLNESLLNSKLIQIISLGVKEIYVRIESQIHITCSFKVEDPCRVDKSQVNSVAAWQSFLKALGEKGITANLVYDLNINNFSYKMHSYKSERGRIEGPSSVGNLKSRFIFQNTKFIEIIKSDFNIISGLTDFKRVFFGSDLDLFFSQLPDITIIQSEVQGFWKLIKQLKEINPNKSLSSCFNYEHLKGSLFWGAMDKTQMRKQDEFCFSSFPTQIKWAKKFGIEKQFVLLDSPKDDFTSDYYDSLVTIGLTEKPIHIVGFAYPLLPEEKDLQAKVLNTVLYALPRYIASVAWENRLSLNDQKNLAESMSIWHEQDFNLNSSGSMFFE
tara:strand:- start:34645 stop:35766 length:1122 start_codon:yes stop_codon:yes gene_type:complete